MSFCVQVKHLLGGPFCSLIWNMWSVNIVFFYPLRAAFHRHSNLIWVTVSVLFSSRIASNVILFFWTSLVHAPSPLFICSTGMTGNYLLTNPLLRPHDTNTRYNNLLAETIVCNTPPPAFHSPGVYGAGLFLSFGKNPGFFTRLTQDRICNEITAVFLPLRCMKLLLFIPLLPLNY